MPDGQLKMPHNRRRSAPSAARFWSAAVLCRFFIVRQPRRKRQRTLSITHTFGSNPKGIVSSSPGLRGTSYPGCGAAAETNPNGVASRTRRPRHNPVGVEANFVAVSQGSSCLATLGFGLESRWDSILRCQKVMGNGKTLPQSKMPDCEFQGSFRRPLSSKSNHESAHPRPNSL